MNLKVDFSIKWIEALGKRAVSLLNAEKQRPSRSNQASRLNQADRPGWAKWPGRLNRMLDLGARRLPPDVKGFLTMGGIAFVWIWTYYQSFPAAILASLLTVAGLPRYRKRLAAKEIQILTRAFGDALHSMKTSLGAGMSLEQSVRRVPGDLGLLYGSDHPLMTAFAQLIRRMDMNAPVEEAFDMMARRLNIPDITVLAKMIQIGKRSGVNLVEVMNISVQTLEEKHAIREEIETLLASRRLEQKILICMPLAMILFLNFSMSAYMTPLFTRAAGRVVMTAALLLQGIGTWLIFRIGAVKI
jgi:tight adherence protein B